MTTYRKTPLVSGEYFHVYNRGNSKQAIFLSNEDKDRFVKLLYLSNSIKGVNFRDDIVDKGIDAWDFERGESLVSIGAWVLMPNHFHIYIISPTRGVGEEENQENEDNIALFMNKLCTSYAKYFNKKYDRIGKLFEGPFRSTHIKNDNQAKYLFSYIHLNPIKLINSKWKENGIDDTATALEYLNTYKWSSYHDHRGILRSENKILQINDFPEFFSKIENFDSEIFSWLEYK
jgi:putative transposase